MFLDFSQESCACETIFLLKVVKHGTNLFHVLFDLFFSKLLTIMLNKDHGIMAGAIVFCPIKLLFDIPTTKDFSQSVFKPCAIFLTISRIVAKTHFRPE